MVENHVGTTLMTLARLLAAAALLLIVVATSGRAATATPPELGRATVFAVADAAQPAVRGAPTYGQRSDMLDLPLPLSVVLLGGALAGLGLFYRPGSRSRSGPTSRR